MNLSIKSICDMRQISTLIDELSNYTEYNAVDIGKTYSLYTVQFIDIVSNIIQLFTIYLELSRCISSMKQAISLLEQVFSQSGKVYNIL